MTAIVYNRAADVERRFSTVAQIRYLDNGSVDWVPLADVDD